MNLIILLFIFALGLISYVLTYIIMRYAVTNKLTVVPNERSLHDIPTPKVGGIAITITWFAGITILFITHFIPRDLYYALICGLVLAFVSLIDDLKDLKPYIRLLFQFITATSAFLILHGLRPVNVAGIEITFSLVTYPFVIIGMVWFINLFNFMDGVDGFASVEVITVSAVLFIMSWNIINILLIVCVAGFLCWNWPKAKIFMGDVGSTQLGFVLLVLGIYFHNTDEFSIINWIMLTSPFWFDATLTLYRRWRNKEQLSKAHKKHAYQRMVQSGFSHAKVNISLILINLLIITLIIIYREFIVMQIPAFLFTLLLLYMITKAVDRRIPFGTEK